MKLLVAILLPLSALLAADLPTARVQDAATRAVALIQKSQKNWYTKASCFSCHQQVLPALAFRAAREHGIPVDEPSAHADAVAAFGFYSNFERAVEYSHIIDPALSDGFGLIAANAAAHPAARTKEGLTALELAKKYNHSHLLASLEPLHAAKQVR